MRARAVLRLLQLTAILVLILRIGSTRWGTRKLKRPIVFNRSQSVSAQKASSDGPHSTTEDLNVHHDADIRSSRSFVITPSKTSRHLSFALAERVRVAASLLIVGLSSSRCVQPVRQVSPDWPLAVTVLIGVHPTRSTIVTAAAAAISTLRRAVHCCSCSSSRRCPSATTASTCSWRLRRTELSRVVVLCLLQRGVGEMRTNSTLLS